MKRFVYTALIGLTLFMEVATSCEVLLTSHKKDRARAHILAAQEAATDWRVDRAYDERGTEATRTKAYQSAVGFYFAQKSAADLSVAQAEIPIADENIRSQSAHKINDVVYKKESVHIDAKKQALHISVDINARPARQTEIGFTRKEVILMIRLSREVKSIVRQVNTKFYGLACAFEASCQKGDFAEILKLINQIRSDIEMFEKFEVIQNLLIPELEDTLNAIEWPLLNYEVYHKDCLKPRDFEQIAWALEAHFESMRKYTYEKRVHYLPEGDLKKIVDKYYDSIWQRACKFVGYYAVYAKRYGEDLSTLRAVYEQIMQNNVVGHYVQPHVPSFVARKQQKIEIARLQKTVQTLHKASKKKGGRLSDTQRAREKALKCMVKGDYAMRTMHYALHRATYEMLEQAGIDPDMYATFTGNLIQQDTHAKSVQSLNVLSAKSPLTKQGQCMKDGALNCAQVGMALNKEGHIAAAMAYTDMCSFIAEKAFDFFDTINSINPTLDAVAWAMRTAGAKDLAASFDTLRTNVDQFCSGFAKGALQGATDFEGIYSGLCNTVESIGHFIKYVGEQEALADALEFGRFDDARAILDANDERIARIVAGTQYVSQQAADFMRRIPSMTPEEWRQAGLSTGNFVGREAVQLGIWKAGFTGICRISNAVVQSVSNCETVIHELALSTQLSGSPVGQTLFDATLRAKRIENICVQIGSKHISGIRAIRPELSKEIFTSVAQGAKAGAQLATESGSKTSVWYSSLFQLSSNLESFLNTAKPGFIDITPKRPTCYKDALLAELKRFKNERLVFGKHVFLIDSKAIKHFLTRHHPSFWEGVIKNNQTYLPKNMMVADIVAIIKQVLNDNRDIVIKNGTNRSFQVESVIDGIIYVVGSEKGRIAQFYAKKIKHEK